MGNRGSRSKPGAGGSWPRHINMSSISRSTLNCPSDVRFGSQITLIGDVSHMGLEL